MRNRDSENCHYPGSLLLVALPVLGHVAMSGAGYLLLWNLLRLPQLQGQPDGARDVLGLPDAADRVEGVEAGECLLDVRGVDEGLVDRRLDDGRRRVLVLGDPGPWMCAGMTGGTLYLRLRPESNLDEAALERRIASGANVELQPVDAGDDPHLHELLHLYADELSRNHQLEEAGRALALLTDWRHHFVKIVPCRSE